MVEEDMPSATASLPSDPQALRALAASLQAALATKERELAARDAEIHAKTLHIEKLRATLALMKRARFGRSPPLGQVTAFRDPSSLPSRGIGPSPLREC